MTVRVWVCLGALALAMGCEAGGGIQAGPPPVWRADSVVTDVPGVSVADDLNFTIPAGATRLRDGTVVIGDLHGGAVRYFDAAGAMVASYGRFGEGPGEFAQVYWLGQCARDTVFVLDARLNRLTVLDGRGRLVFQEQISPDAGRPPPWSLSCAPGGPWAVLRLPSDAGRQSPRSTAPMARAPLDLLDRHGRTVREVGDVATGEPQVLGRLTRLAVAPGVLYVGTAESAAVDVYDATGRPMGIVRVGSVERDVQEVHWERAVDERLWMLAQSRDRAAIRDWMLQLPRPDHLPPYATLTADPDGALWVGLSFPGDTSTRVRGVRADGRPVADMVLPVGLSVLEVGLDYVLGTLEDSTGELHVMVLHLDRTER